MDGPGRRTTDPSSLTDVDEGHITVHARWDDGATATLKVRIFPPPDGPTAMLSTDFATAYAPAET